MAKWVRSCNGKNAVRRRCCRCQLDEPSGRKHSSTVSPSACFVSRTIIAVAPSAEQLPRVLVRMLHLARDHARVLATGAHELFVRPALDDATFLHEENDIGASDGR